jgi:hypothetical protein
MPCVSTDRSLFEMQSLQDLDYVPVSADAFRVTDVVEDSHVRYILPGTAWNPPLAVETAFSHV